MKFCASSSGKMRIPSVSGRIRTFIVPAFKRLAVLCILFLIAKQSPAQSFTALEGSPYGGAVNTTVQSAAAADMPFHWDVFLAGANAFISNNIVEARILKGLAHPVIDSTNEWEAHAFAGDRKRWATMQADVHLLNVLFSLKQQGTIGAGWNLRSAGSADQMRFNLQDSMSIQSFLRNNALDKSRNGRGVTQQWMEWYVTYARVIKETGYDQWKAGATLKFIRGLSAVEAELNALELQPSGGNARPVFSQVNGQYGYSDNLGELQSANSSRENLRSLMNGTPLSVGMDIGVAYVSKQLSNIAGIRYDAATRYDWKLEASITDIGRLKYTYGSMSVSANGVKEPLTPNHLVQLVDSASKLSEINDSLAHYFNMQPQEGDFTVSLPTAFRINADKRIAGGWALNLRAVVDASWLNAGTDFKIHTTSYLMLTPRWENKWLGFYLPCYLNLHGTALLGAGVRVGPLIAGIHDFQAAFSRSSGSAGAYIGVVIRHLWPGRADCPPVH